MQLMCYTTLARMRVHQVLKNTDTSDDFRLLDKARAASEEIERECGGRFFQPLQETRTFDWTSNEYLSFRGFDLLTLTSIIDGTGNTKLTAALIMQHGKFSDATLYGPWSAVRIDTTKDFLLYNITPFRSIQVKGAWGWHEDYGTNGAFAWYDSNVTVQDNPLAANATTITTSTNDSTITDAWGQKWPTAANCGTVQVGHLIQVDSEWMQVTGYTDATHITVIRGANGTGPGVSHNLNAHIMLYAPPRDVMDICTTWAAWLYHQDSIGFEKTTIPVMGGGQIKTIADPTGVLKERLNGYIKRRVA